MTKWRGRGGEERHGSEKWLRDLFGRKSMKSIIVIFFDFAPKKLVFTLFWLNLLRFLLF